jgi:hypothetical protein
MNVEIGTETPIFLFWELFVSKFRYFVFAVRTFRILYLSYPGPFEAGPFEAGPFEVGPYVAGPFEAGPFEACLCSARF